MPPCLAHLPTPKATGQHGRVVQICCFDAGCGFKNCYWPSSLRASTTLGSLYYSSLPICPFPSWDAHSASQLLPSHCSSQALTQDRLSFLFVFLQGVPGLKGEKVRKKSLHGMSGEARLCAPAQGLEDKRRSSLGKGVLAPLLWSRERQGGHRAFCRKCCIEGGRGRKSLAW